MCGISALYILDKKGRVLISRHFRPDLPSNIYDAFNKKILEYDEYTLKYPFLYKDPSSRAKIITYSTSTSTTISISSQSPEKTIMQYSSSPSYTLSSTSFRAISKTCKKNLSAITSL